ncbi:MAG: hypothetical protein ABS36_11395 [Acidobacteria bacterium SCN 69-37]|nr:MAG: hypothetical protein ABS36_11395 [Acidobacteria bacterium SCN 69-37]
MLKKLVIGVVALVIVAGALLSWRAQAIFSSDLVRTTVAAQLSRALGQPVEVGAISAAIFPRVTMVLSDVRIGEPAAITLARLDVGASARALLSRRIDDASLRVDGATIALPLPAFALGTDTTPTPADADEAPITLGSIDEIVLDDVTVTSGGRTLRGDVRIVPEGAGLRIDRMALRLDETPVDVTGTITNLEGPVGTLALRAASIDMLALQAFATDFAAGAGLGDPASAPAPQAAAGDSTMDLRLDLTTDRATFGTLTLETLAGAARLTSGRLAIDTLTFDLFDGHYAGAIALGLADTPTFQLDGTLRDISMADLMTWAGRPGAMTGRLSGAVDVTGAGTTPDAVIGSTTGTARVDVTQGTITGLALVRTVVVASSMRAGATPAAPDDGNGEAFSRMGASFTIGQGLARTTDLRFESNDVSLDGAGQLGLDGTHVDLAGRVQLSEALTQQAGRDLVRYTQQDRRVTIPVTITGSAGNMDVRLETTDVLRRAITNKAVEEAGSAIRRGLGGLLGR